MYRAQTWKQHIHEFNEAEAWASIIDELVEDYVQWKYASLLTSQPQPPPMAEPNEWDLTIEVLDVYSLDHKMTEHQCSNTKATSGLVQAGYLAALHLLFRCAHWNFSAPSNSSN